MSLPILTFVGTIQKMETRTTQSGKAVTSLNLSAGEKNAKGEYDNLYIKADFWEKQSIFVSQYFKEGDTIIVTGKLVTTNYTKADNTKVYETKFLFPSASFVPKPKDQTQNNNYPNQDKTQGDDGYIMPQTTNQNAPMTEIDIDEQSIPFAPIGMSEGGYYAHLV